MTYPYDKKTAIFPDCTIISNEGDCFYLSKVILSYKSRLFRDIFKTDEDTSEITLDYKTQDILNWLLTFHFTMVEPLRDPPNVRIATYIKLCHQYETDGELINKAMNNLVIADYKDNEDLFDLLGQTNLFNNSDKLKDKINSSIVTNTIPQELADKIPRAYLFECIRRSEQKNFVKKRQRTRQRTVFPRTSDVERNLFGC